VLEKQRREAEAAEAFTREKEAAKIGHGYRLEEIAAGMKPPKEEEIPLYDKKTGGINPLIFVDSAEKYLPGFPFYRLADPTMTKERNEAKDLIVRRLVGIWGAENEQAIRAGADKWFNSVWQITNKMGDKEKKISWGDFMKRYGSSLLAIFAGLGPAAAAAPFLLPKESIPRMGEGPPPGMYPTGTVPEELQEKENLLQRVGKKAKKGFQKTREFIGF
jgi:hypothetical protein